MRARGDPLVRDHCIFPSVAAFKAGFHHLPLTLNGMNNAFNVWYMYIYVICVPSIVLNSCFPMFSLPLIRPLLHVAVSIGIATLLMFEKHASTEVPAMNMNVAMHNFWS